MLLFLVFVSLRSDRILKAQLIERSRSLVYFEHYCTRQENIVVVFSSLDRDWFIIFWAKVATKWLPWGDDRYTVQLNPNDIEIFIMV